MVLTQVGRTCQKLEKTLTEVSPLADWQEPLLMSQGHGAAEGLVLVQKLYRKR